ncbi:hypothetical protein N7468_009862 [Penicillium chermesinum]|uniref:Uncharacterized protein n=1 Tax=Penicillium chermesinum TaxID=63820 RepID=A0A9W9NBN5_9EURO|nr:uncharacterized protein N7468_009862 [Penicillium chermesinum]KAJ5216854.1 hypothetical protein N7468_009862 [Penicillium chermesinum]KAJ6171528.1 hypothetical protein N7470_000595 [Penicillium chermesinum]
MLSFLMLFTIFAMISVIIFNISLLSGLWLLAAISGAVSCLAGFTNLRSLFWLSHSTVLTFPREIANIKGLSPFDHWYRLVLALDDCMPHRFSIWPSRSIDLSSLPQKIISPLRIHALSEVEIDFLVGMGAFVGMGTFVGVGIFAGIGVIGVSVGMGAFVGIVAFVGMEAFVGMGTFVGVGIFAGIGVIGVFVGMGAFVGMEAFVGVGIFAGIGVIGVSVGMGAFVVEPGVPKVFVDDLSGESVQLQEMLSWGETREGNHRPEACTYPREGTTEASTNVCQSV